ncbi:hypothetical protein GCM10027098_34970 [Bowmanella dokdonensis]
MWIVRFQQLFAKANGLPANPLLTDKEKAGGSVGLAFADLLQQGGCGKAYRGKRRLETSASAQLV